MLGQDKRLNATFVVHRGQKELMLLVFGGLPAVGKTAIATVTARGIGAVHLRIDSIEQALRNADVAISGPEGYVVAYAGC